jgi:tRNA(Ile)-lysidine synthetase-like protein
VNSPPIQLPPTGTHWAAAVSGGADSVAMLLLCRSQVARVIHVDHETREGASTDDAAFVVALCGRLAIPVDVVRRSAVEHRLSAESPRSTSARFRAIRQLAYQDVTASFGLGGVLLAHHADDQAETVALRLLRGSSFAGLAGIAADANIGRVRLLRPLLAWTRDELRNYLRSVGQPWREDASNASPNYGRNRVRRSLAADDELRPALLRLSESARAYRDALGQHGPKVLGSDFPLGAFGQGPTARHAARLWLSQHAPHESVNDRLITRFLAWTADAAGPARMTLPGNTTVRRTRGIISLEAVKRTMPRDAER